MSNLENHNPQTIRQISKEVKNLTTEQLEGIRISVNESNLTDIQAVIDGPGMCFGCLLRSCKIGGSKRAVFRFLACDIDPVYPLRTFISFPFSMFRLLSLQLEHLTLAASSAFNSHYLRIFPPIHRKHIS